MKHTYNRLAAGERLRLKRTLLGFTQDEMAEKIDRASKYYADIERGTCGMSIETLLALSSALNLSLDYIIYGKPEDEKAPAKNSDEITALVKLISTLPPRQQKYALELLRLFILACNPDSAKVSEKEK